MQYNNIKGLVLLLLKYLREMSHNAKRLLHVASVPVTCILFDNNYDKLIKKRKHYVLYFLASQSLNDNDKLHVFFALCKRGKEHMNDNNDNINQAIAEDPTKAALEPASL